MGNRSYVHDLNDQELMELITELNSSIPFVPSRLNDLRKTAVAERNTRKEHAELELKCARTEAQRAENRVRLLSGLQLKELDGIDGKVTE